MTEVVSSLLVGLGKFIVTRYLDSKKKKNPKDEFLKSSKLFYSETSPYLINNVLNSKSKGVFGRLKRLKFEEKYYILPYIDLIDGGNFDVLNSLVDYSLGESESEGESEIISFLKNEMERTLTNNKTFVLREISTDSDDTKKLMIGISDYYSTISTSDFYFFELIREFPHSFVWRFFYVRFGSLIDNWIKLLENVVLRGMFSNYSASIGVSVLTVLNIDGGFKYNLCKSSNKKATAAGDKHVIPAFMYQPIGNDDNNHRHIDFNFNILREFGEECFDIVELENPVTYHSAVGIINNDLNLKLVREGLESGNILLYKTGLVLDIYRMRPEVTFLLMVLDADLSCEIIKKMKKLNWENKDLEMHDLMNEREYNDVLGINKEYSSLCPPGMAALINGRKKALEIITNQKKQAT